MGVKIDGGTDFPDLHLLEELVEGGHITTGGPYALLLGSTEGFVKILRKLKFAVPAVYVVI